MNPNAFSLYWGFPDRIVLGAAFVDFFSPTDLRRVREGLSRGLSLKTFNFYFSLDTFLSLSLLLIILFLPLRPPTSLPIFTYLSCCMDIAYTVNNIEVSFLSDFNRQRLCGRFDTTACFGTGCASSPSRVFLCM